MRKLLKPINLILVVAVPTVLLMIMAGVLWSGSISAELKWLWAMPTAAMAVFVALARLKRNQEQVDKHTCLALAITYMAMTVIVCMVWVFFSSVELFLLPLLIAFALPALYGVIGLAYYHTSKKAAVWHVVVTALVPLVWYQALQLMGALSDASLFAATLQTLGVILALFCVYLIIFLIFIIVSKRRKDAQPQDASDASDAEPLFEPRPKKKPVALIAIFVLVLPLIGLLLNSALSDVLGDFSSLWFFIIAVGNGVLLLLPTPQNARLRFAVWYFMGAGYTFILYFAVVFMPYLPLGLIGLMYWGVGALLFTPLAAAIIQGVVIVREFNMLKASVCVKKVLAILCAGLVMLPICFTALCFADKANFDAARMIMAHPESRSGAVSVSRLANTLEQIRPQWERDSLLGNDMTRFPGQTPILSSVYSDIVLLGTTNSDRMIRRMNAIFLGSDAPYDASKPLSDLDARNARMTADTGSVTLASAAGATRFDASMGVYVSSIDLVLKNESERSLLEYVTAFTLPEGAYISDYYLDVGETRKQGILADRRAALSTYASIVRQNTDPGLLHYIGDDTLELRVFPFAGHETRRTGFEILHAENIELTIGDRTIQLGGTEPPREIKGDGVSFLPAEKKRELAPVQRQPKTYFVIDASLKSDIPWHIEQVERYAQAQNITDADVIFASHRLTRCSLAEMRTRRVTAEGGFNLGGALKYIFANEDKDHYPLVIFVSDLMPAAMLDGGLYAARQYPECKAYYRLEHDLYLKPYRLSDHVGEERVSAPDAFKALQYGDTFVRDDGKGQLVYGNLAGGIGMPVGNRYVDAMRLGAFAQKSLLSEDENDLSIVRASFRVRVLTPYTAFIVVETDEQERELLKLQAEYLTSAASAQQLQKVDEPPLWVCAAILACVWACSAWSKRRRSSADI